MITARCYISEAIERDTEWGLINEGFSRLRNEAYLTMAGWIRHLALLIHYFKQLGVFSLDKTYYEPRSDALRQFFGPESGIDSKEKAFAFLLGIVYGKVLQVQSARGINVSSNALAWLRRLTLTGKDLPELYVKVREKLIAYKLEGNDMVSIIVEEIGWLGVEMGSNIVMDEKSACYFLLLGQSMATTIIPSKSKTDKKGA